jgi:glyoxylate/hydroxypyruvate reductase A
MINVLFAATPERWTAFEQPLKQACAAAGLNVNIRDDFSPEAVDYIVYAPNSGLSDFTPYTRTRAVLSLWAGVEKIVGNETLTMPLTRMVDPGLTQSMIEWVCGHVLRYHLGMDAHIVNPAHDWTYKVPPLARDRRVCVLGMGALGAAVAQSLKGLGFAVHGWSRNPKSIEGIPTFHGTAGLDSALGAAEILVLLLPDTPATENTLNRRSLSLLPRGAFVINPGRGPLIDDDALIAALDDGQVAHATLDVFRIEPLPKSHPFWPHPKVTVTPHIAAETRPTTSAEVVAENIRRGEAGEPFLHLVDRTQGY